MTRPISIVAILMICLAAGASAQFVQPRAVTPEQSGDEAAAAGKYNDAIASYKQQWQSCRAPEGDGNAECETLRDRLTTKMATALPKLPTPPTLPEDADYHAAKGMAFLKGAKSPADVLKVVSEFQSAVNLAPWSYDYQFNLAVALKGAANFKTALPYCKYARNLAKNDDERRETTALRAEIDAASEMAASSAAEAERNSPKTQALNIMKSLQERFEHRIVTSNQGCLVKDGRQAFTCNDADANGSTWTNGARDGTYSWMPFLTPDKNADWSSKGYGFRFQIDPNDPQAILIIWADDGKLYLRGAVKGPELSNVQWTHPGPDTTTVTTIRVYAGENGTQVLELMSGCDAAHNCNRERWLLR